MDWSEENTFKLINYYEKYPCSFDISCRDCHNKVKKKTANDKIANELGTNAT